VSTERRLKFIADADLSRNIVIGVRLREPAVDFLTAREGGTLGVGDPEVLGRGAAMSRVVVSSDQGTMPGHYWEFLNSHDSPGMIIVPQSVELARAIDKLLLIWRESSPESLINQIRWIKARSS
jgi:hypothetical protein